MQDSSLTPQPKTDASVSLLRQSHSQACVTQVCDSVFEPCWTCTIDPVLQIIEKVCLQQQTGSSLCALGFCFRLHREKALETSQLQMRTRLVYQSQRAGALGKQSGMHWRTLITRVAELCLSNKPCCQNIIFGQRSVSRTPLFYGRSRLTLGTDWERISLFIQNQSATSFQGFGNNN